MGADELALTMTNPAVGREGSRSEGQEALGRAQRGEHGAFDELIVRHQGRVLMTARRLLGSREDAQDAAQEVFLRLYRHLHRVDPKRPLLPLLYRMTVNVSHDMRRRRHGNSTVAVEDLAAASEALAPGNLSARTEQKQLLAAALETLTPKERAALVLRDLEGLSTAEVANALRSSETTVRSQISSARVKIRKFLDRYELHRL